MLRHILQPIVRNTRIGVRSYHVPDNVKPPSMDEIPVPNGSWQESHAKLQRKYNLQLIAGIVIFIGTIAYGRVTGLLWLNYSAPVPKDED
ncbi:hypothetical protein WN48_04161 [Eufriesea mexicana]|uniref:Deltamethrin resistance protein prag01 domain-containing protein n=1 Tax=Eufriesea mexicana TaxID=516756 RepID=A0A310SA38_9HYME|nr:PREDICTED: uncharacterized protein LOC108549991 [Eufriesea mexicana]OAD55911.1 hypothetical protein WN48_04161 [Eufriesea mexicana]